MTNPAPLNPAAQTVLDAFWGTINDKFNIYDRRCAQLAAALRAAADQNPPYDLTTCEYDEGWGEAMAAIFAIAAELEGISSTSGKD